MLKDKDLISFSLVRKPGPDHEVKIKVVVDEHDSDGKFAEYSCKLGYTIPQCMPGYIDCIIGRLWFRVNEPLFNELKSLFGYLYECVDLERDPTDFGFERCGVRMDIIDDDRIGIYVYDSLICQSHLFDKSMFRYICQYLNNIDRNVFIE